MSVFRFSLQLLPTESYMLGVCMQCIFPPMFCQLYAHSNIAQEKLLWQHHQRTHDRHCMLLYLPRRFAAQELILFYPIFGYYSNTVSQTPRVSGTLSLFFLEFVLYKIIPTHISCFMPGSYVLVVIYLIWSVSKGWFSDHHIIREVSIVWMCWRL